MKIKDETKPKYHTFDTLKHGDCFMRPHGTYYYLKMEDVCNEIGETEYNAVILEGGQPTFFDNNEEVIFLEAEVIIKQFSRT